MVFPGHGFAGTKDAAYAAARRYVDTDVGMLIFVVGTRVPGKLTTLCKDIEVTMRAVGQQIAR